MEGTRRPFWIYSLLSGVVLAAIIIQAGNPITLENAPLPGFAAAGQTSWLNSQRGWLIALLALAGLTLGRRKLSGPRWLLALPAGWLGWQFVSGLQSVDPQLTRVTLLHFTGVVACFYCGLLSDAGVDRPSPFWWALITALVVVAWTGWNQHFGGLEETRIFYEKLFKGEQPPEIQQQFDTPEFRKLFVSRSFQLKIASKRIFGTFVYPNALAGALLLLFPPTLVALHQSLRKWPFVARGVITGTFACLELGCIYWSGSKGAWLIMLLLVLVVVVRFTPSARTRIWLVSIILLAGLSGFGLKYAGYFAAGATSASARLSYWRAAILTAIEHPVFGTGPGTFSKAYARLKRPDEEMARLTHNDYLEQACDSGLIGFLTFLAWIGGFGYVLYRKSPPDRPLLCFAATLGLAGWSLHALGEFGLYIPGAAFPAFFIFGSLAGLKLAEGALRSGRTANR